MDARGGKRLILVTGAPRSGTTAVGRMLGLGTGVGTLHEPFNLLVGLREIEHYFEIPGTGTCSAEKFDDCIGRLRDLRLKFKPGVFPREQGLRRYFKQVFGGRAHNSYRLCRWQPGLHTLIWKDPFAALAADRIATRHGIDVVVTLRNPWAVAASFKRMGWAFDLDDLVMRLRERGLSLPAHTTAWNARHTPVANAALLWHVIYASLQNWSRDSARLTLLSLDRVVAEPEATYAGLYKRLGLVWSERIAARISRNYTSETGRDQPQGQRAHDQRRDLGAVNTYWKGLLNEEERALVSEINAELWDSLCAVNG